MASRPRIAQFFIFILCHSSLYGLEYTPWFNPPFEFHAIPAYEYGEAYRVHSPAGNFTDFDYIHWTRLNLEVSPWPYWDVQLQVDGAATDAFSYTFLGGSAVIRYNWMDDTVNDPFTLTTGVIFSGMRSIIFTDDSFYYNGNFNTELGTALGKACYQRGCTHWSQRGWLYAGFGIANRGSPWFTGFLDWDFRLNERVVWSWMTNFLIGFGSNDYLETEPFAGYANIGYRAINLISKLEWQLRSIGSLTVNALYNIYGSNTSAFYWAVGAQLDIPFSF